MFNLTPWKKRKESDITLFRNEMNTLFDRFLKDWGSPAIENWMDCANCPKVDIVEDNKTITVRAELPGVDAKEIEINLDGRTLTLKGERKSEKEEKEQNYYYKECSYGSFSRTVDLNAEVNADDVDASYDKGILKLVLKKIKPTQAKKIQIKSN